ncbi:DUF998 domain-containing protein [Microbacteriaceae bacterium VKM Ac-2855]|nr:DUF998 domain-containing protein [Microbacteriaceae bacterium VKM Ac-2855]
MPPTSPPPRLATPILRRRILLRSGAVIVLAGLVVLLVARSTLRQAVYVSEMGAAGMPTSTAFSAALLLVAAGGAMVAVASRAVRSRLRLLSRWLPSTSILVASLCFAFSSQVTCTAGCPLPVGASFTWQDLLHTSAAVIGFAAACVAMLQVATAEAQPRVARLSLAAGVLVAVIAGAGAILSLLRMSMGVGGTLEFVATGIAILWLAAYGLSLSGVDEPITAPARSTVQRGSPHAAGRDPGRAPAPAPMLRPEEP